MKRIEIPATPREPHVTVKRDGRFVYKVQVVDESIPWGLRTAYVLGQKRAERKAKRMLRRYRREQGWLTEPAIIYRGEAT